MMQTDSAMTLDTLVSYVIQLVATNLGFPVTTTHTTHLPVS